MGGRILRRVSGEKPFISVVRGSDRPSTEWSQSKSCFFSIHISFLLTPVVAISHNIDCRRAPAKVFRGQSWSRDANCSPIKKGFRVFGTLGDLICAAGEEPMRPHPTHQFSQVVMACHRARAERGFKPRTIIEARR